MAKDPALLWYFGDWTLGTVTMTRHVKGCYIDLLAAQFNNGPLSLDEIKTVLGSDFGPSWPALQKKFVKDDKGLYYNERLKEEKEKRINYSNSRRQSRLKTDEDNVKIYIVKDIDSGNVKIGSSVNPLRRFAELCNQENPAITIGDRNYVLVWYSNVLKRTEEKVLHDLYAKKRLTGEWFNLSEDEIQSIMDRYSGTYVNRTLSRTEIENVNENKNQVTTDELPSFLNLKVWKEWEQYRKEKGKKLTPLTVQKQLSFLSTHQKDHVAIIENSIQNGWTGLFPLKSEKKHYSGNEYNRDREKMAARVGDLDYEARIQRDNAISQLATKFKVK